MSVIAVIQQNYDKQRKTSVKTSVKSLGNHSVTPKSARQTNIESSKFIADLPKHSSNHPINKSLMSNDEFKWFG